MAGSDFTQQKDLDLGNNFLWRAAMFVALCYFAGFVGCFHEDPRCVGMPADAYEKVVPRAADFLCLSGRKIRTISLADIL